MTKEDMHWLESHRNVFNDPDYQQFNLYSQRAMTQEELDARNKGLQNTPPGWHVEDTTPSGIHRMLPDDYTPPVSLPHNRTLTQTSFSAKFWFAAGLLIFAGCLALAVHFA